MSYFQLKRTIKKNKYSRSCVLLVSGGWYKSFMSVHVSTRGKTVDNRMQNVVGHCC